MRLLPLVLLALSTTVSALGQQPPREIFPSDYTPSPCAAANSCATFSESEMSQAGHSFLGFQIDGQWIIDHGPEIKAALAPLCRKHGTCLAQPTASYMFCDDILAA